MGVYLIRRKLRVCGNTNLGVTLVVYLGATLVVYQGVSSVMNHTMMENRCVIEDTNSLKNKL